MTPSILGRSAVRFMACEALAHGDFAGAEGYRASQPWLDGEAIKRAIANALTTGGGAAALVGTGVDADIVAAIAQFSAWSTLSAGRQFPIGSRVIAVSGSIGASTSEGGSKPISQIALTGYKLLPRKSAATIVVTAESLRLPLAEAAIATDLARAAAVAEDDAMLNPAIATSLLSATAGAAQIASSGSSVAQIDADLKAALAAVAAGASNLQSAYWLLSPTTAVYLSTLRSGGLLSFPDIGVKGGTLAGLPALVSAGVAGFVGLIDTQGAVFGVDVSGQVALSTSTEASVEMAAPATNPPTAATVMVSLFQLGLVGMRCELFRSWSLVRPGLAAAITGVAY